MRDQGISWKKEWQEIKINGTSRRNHRLDKDSVWSQIFLQNFNQNDISRAIPQG